MTFSWHWNHTFEHLIVIMLTLRQWVFYTYMQSILLSFTNNSQVQRIIQFFVMREITNPVLCNGQTFIGENFHKCCGFYKSLFYFPPWWLVALSRRQEVHPDNRAFTLESPDSLLGVSYVVLLLKRSYHSTQQYKVRSPIASNGLLNAPQPPSSCLKLSK